MRLGVRALGLTLGVTRGAGVFVLGLIAWLGWGRALAEVLGSLYLGFGPDPLGSLIGGVWGFIDGGAWGRASLSDKWGGL